MKGQPCRRCGRPLDANADCLCTEPPEKFKPKSNVELDELLELQNQFANDLELVFQGKQLEFGDHLRGMLFELWVRGRDVPLSTVKELEELRELQRDGLQLKKMVGELLQEELTAVSDRFQATFESVLQTHFKDHLVKELNNYSYDLDEAVVRCLLRVLNPNGTFTISGMGDRVGLTVEGGGQGGFPSFHGQEDDAQKNLRDRLEWEGILPSALIPPEWEPLYQNIDTGEVASFHRQELDTRTPLGREVRVHLAWDGSSWRFPNPRPNACRENLTIFVDGEVQKDTYRWEFFDEWCLDRNGRVFLRVELPYSAGTEIVEAIYRVPS